MATDVNCWLPQSSAGTWLFRSITDSVIPEGAKRLSGIQNKTIGRWIPDHGSAASGMTIIGLFASFE